MTDRVLVIFALLVVALMTLCIVPSPVANLLNGWMLQWMLLADSHRGVGAACLAANFVALVWLFGWLHERGEHP